MRARSGFKQSNLALKNRGTRTDKVQGALATLATAVPCDLQSTVGLPFWMSSRVVDISDQVGNLRFRRGKCQDFSALGSDAEHSAHSDSLESKDATSAKEVKSSSLVKSFFWNFVRKSTCTQVAQECATRKMAREAGDFRAFSRSGSGVSVITHGLGNQWVDVVQIRFFQAVPPASANTLRNEVERVAQPWELRSACTLKISWPRFKLLPRHRKLMVVDLPEEVSPTTTWDAAAVLRRQHVL